MILPRVQRALSIILDERILWGQTKIISNYFAQLCAIITCRDDALWEYRNNGRNKLTFARSVYIPAAFTRNGRQPAVRMLLLYTHALHRLHCFLVARSN
jgi:hypothetical protein